MAKQYRYKRGKVLSTEFVTRKELATLNLGQGGSGVSSEELSAIQDRLKQLEASGVAVQSDSVSPEELDALLSQMESMQEQLNSLSTAPSITSFSASGISTVNDIGTTINGAKLTWSINQNIAKADYITIQKSGGSVITLDKSVRSYSFDDTITSDTTFTLTVYYTYDGKASSVKKALGIYFRRPIIYGTSAMMYGDITSDKVLSLKNRKRGTNLENSGVSWEGVFDADYGQYFYFAIPRQLLSKLQLSLNFGLVTVNGGIVLIENDGTVLYKTIDRVTDNEYKGIDVTIGSYTTKYALIRSQLSGIGKIYFTSKIK